MARRGSLSPQLVRVPASGRRRGRESRGLADPRRRTLQPGRLGIAARATRPGPAGDAWTSACWSRGGSRWRFRPGAVLNIGFGISDVVLVVAAQEGLLDDLTITIEQGTIGGLPMRGRAWPPNRTWRRSSIRSPSSTSTKVGDWTWRSCRSPRSTRPGTSMSASSARASRDVAGSSDISQEREGVVFVACSGSAGDTRVENGRLRVVGHGRVMKFRKQVEHVTFSGRARGRRREAGALASPSGPSSASARAGWSCSSSRPGATSSGTCRRDGIPARDRARPQTHGPRDLRAATPGAPRAVGCLGGRPPARAHRAGVTGAPRPFRFGLIGAGVAAEIHVTAMRTVPGVEVHAPSPMPSSSGPTRSPPGTASPTCTRGGEAPA